MRKQKKEFPTIQDMMDELRQFDPKTPVLFHFWLEISGKTDYGYTPYEVPLFKTVRVIKKRKYVYKESKSPRAFKVLAVGSNI